MCVGGIALLKNHQDRIPRPHPPAGLVCPLMCGGSGHSRRAGRFCTGFSFVKFIYFSAGLGLCCRRRAFSSCCAGLLIAVASLVAEHGQQSMRASVVASPGLQSTGSGVAHRLCGSAGMRDLPSSEIPPVSPAMVGRFFITEPPEKPCSGFWTWHLSPGLKEAVRTASEEGDSVAERGSAEDEEGQTLSHPGWWRRLWLVHSLSFVPESPGAPLLPESPQAQQTHDASLQAT